MTWTVHTCLITLAILCVWQPEVAETCTCPRVHPQEQFCSTDTVIKATIDGTLKVGITNHGNFSSYGYVKRLKTFRGTCDNIDTVHTLSSYTMCGVSLSTHTEYLLSGTVSGTRMNTNACYYIRQWDKLTDSQRVGVVSHYELGCGCKFTYCASSPCTASSPAECLWGDDETEKKLFGKSTKGYTCTMKSDKSCAWCMDGENDCIEIKDP